MTAISTTFSMLSNSPLRIHDKFLIHPTTPLPSLGRRLNLARASHRSLAAPFPSAGLRSRSAGVAPASLALLAVYSSERHARQGCAVRRDDRRSAIDFFPVPLPTGRGSLGPSVRKNRRRRRNLRRPGVRSGSVVRPGRSLLRVARARQRKGPPPTGMPLP